MSLSTSGGLSGQYHDVTYNTNPDDDVDELLAELQENIARNASNDREHEDPSVREAKAFVASSSRLARETSRGHPDDRELAEEDLERDAKAYVDQVLDQVRLESREDPEQAREQSESHPGTSEEQQQSSDKGIQSPPPSPTRASPPLKLPDTPSKPPTMPIDDTKVPRSPAEDLPAAPTFAPNERPVRIKSWTGTDSVPTTWCCICSDDAEVKCLDCDGQIFCPRCWREMHFEEGSSEERRHRAVNLLGSGGSEMRQAC